MRLPPWLVLTACLVAPSGLTAARGDEGASLLVPPSAGDADEGAVMSLEDRLTMGLKVRRPVDVAFVEQVATLVQQGKLPHKLVDSTYLWAVKRRQSYPFPAFQQALRLQADRLGVTLD